eukprot:2264250-Amphidinium_carterae.1
MPELPPLVLKFLVYVLPMHADLCWQCMCAHHARHCGGHGWARGLGYEPRCMRASFMPVPGLSAMTFGNPTRTGEQHMELTFELEQRIKQSWRVLVFLTPTKLLKEGVVREVRVPKHPREYPLEGFIHTSVLVKHSLHVDDKLLGRSQLVTSMVLRTPVIGVVQGPIERHMRRKGNLRAIHVGCKQGGRKGRGSKHEVITRGVFCAFKACAMDCCMHS